MVYEERLEIKQRAVMDMKERLYYLTPEDIEFQVAYRNLEFLQKSYQCCGIEDYTDWKNSTANQLGVDVPDSCCEFNMKGCGMDALGNGGVHIHKRGCVTGISEDIEDNAETARGVVAALILVQITMCAVAFLLRKRMRKSHLATIICR